MGLLKKLSVTSEDFTLNASALSDGDIATISLVSYIENESKSTVNHKIFDEKESTEVYVDPIELREMIDALSNVLTLLEREGE